MAWIRRRRSVSEVAGRLLSKEEVVARITADIEAYRHRGRAGSGKAERGSAVRAWSKIKPLAKEEDKNRAK